jgi:hypothetical protein
MAASAAALSYEVLSKTSIGGRWLTVTKVSIAGEAEEYKAKGIALNPTSLGLPDGLLDFGLVNLLLDETNAKSFDAQIVGKKLVLFQAGKEKTWSPELTEAEGKALKGWAATIVSVGR